MKQNKMQTYIPETWVMLKDSIYGAQDAIRNGIENTQELLAIHDSTLGRCRKSNRLEAERLEKEIAAMKSALEAIQKPNGIAPENKNEAE